MPAKKKGDYHKFIMTDDIREKIGPRAEIEIWDIFRYDGKETNYLISTTGKIKRRGQNRFEPIKYKTQIYRDNWKYLTAAIRVEGKVKQLAVHRMVALTFISIPDKYLKAGLTAKDLQVNHMNGITFDNYSGNLEWCTNKENMEHASRMKLMKSGEDNPNASLTNLQVHAICKDLELNTFKVREIAKKHSVSEHTVSNIKNGHVFADIASQYKIKRNPRYKPKLYVDDELAHKICKKLEKGESNREVADHFELPIEVIRQIRNGKRAAHIVKQYKIDTSNLIEFMSEDAVHAICKELAKGIRPCDVAAMFNTTSTKVCNIRTKKSYQHITKLYTFP